jgi:hypothetical protein
MYHTDSKKTTIPSRPYPPKTGLYLDKFAASTTGRILNLPQANPARVTPVNLVVTVS